MNWVAIFAPDWSELVDVLDADDSCRSYERCGGCGECLLMQASHRGMRAAPSYDPLPKDAPGLLAAERRGER